MPNLKFFKNLHIAGLVLGALSLYLVSPDSKHWADDIALSLLAVFSNAFFLARIMKREKAWF